MRGLCKHAIRGVVFLAAVGGLQTQAAGLAEALKNPEAIAEVKAGKREVANAAWWGFDERDATDALQSAVDSGAAKVIVPYLGTREWIVRPITLASDQELVFEPGVVVSAKRGEFRSGGASLFTAIQKSNITITGYGATWRMWKRDYMGPRYVKAEWRMGLALLSSTNVKVYGLTIRGSGGDGLYLGVSGSRKYCKDIHVKDVVFDEHTRQGVSIISAENLLIENCRMTNTTGTGPAAGVDFEPNDPTERLVNCVVRNCVFENNDGPGLFVYANPLNDASKTVPISILVENCLVRRCSRGFGVMRIHDTGPDGEIEFRNCVVEETLGDGIFIRGKSSKKTRLRFVECKLYGTAWQTGVPINFSLEQEGVTKQVGGVDFVDCVVFDQRRSSERRDRPFMRATEKVLEYGLFDVKGNITLVRPNTRNHMDLGDKLVDVDLRIDHVVPEGWDDVPAPEPYVPRAASTRTYSDNETFGDLMATHRVILDLPVAGWRFRTDPADAGAKEKWHRVDLDEKGWNGIEIKRFWEEQGWAGYDGVGWYRLSFEMPAPPPARPLLLVVGAADESATVWVNDRRIGVHDIGPDAGWLKRFRMDITSALRVGKNQITFRVVDTTGAGGLWKSIKIMAPK